MKRLFLMRHAKSSWSDSGLSDHERPLTRRGRRDAKRLGKHLAAGRQGFELVLCSTAARARQTWKLVAHQLEQPPKAEFDASLYLPSVAALTQRLRAVPNGVSSVLVVGHSPSLDALILSLSSGADGGLRARIAEKLPTAALALLTLDASSFEELGKAPLRLQVVLTPRDFVQGGAARSIPEKAQPVVLDRAATALEAARRSVASAVEQIRANTEGARLGVDAEYIHQLRIGVRRLRVALRLFRKPLDGTFPAELEQELRWVFQRLGQVRDYDVFLRDVIDPIAEQRPSRSLRTLREKVRKQRALALERARGAIASERYTQLLATLLAGEAALANTHDDAKPLRRWARKRLDRRLDKVLALEDALAAHEPTARHELRKQLKKLRYSSEFLAAAFPARRRYPRLMAKLQEALGDLNDVAVGERLLKQALRELGSGQSRAALADRLRAGLDARAVAGNLALARSFDKFVHAKPPWR